MATKKLSDGVGKKIVEALKKQSEIEINPVPYEQEQEEINSFDEIVETLSEINTEPGSEIPEESFLDDFSSDNTLDEITKEDADSLISEEAPLMGQPFVNYQPLTSNPPDSFMKDLETFEIPSNIAVLKKLISQLPSGVTRHTGAQIIKQTMEALGISMKSVLQEAQQVQDGLNNSVKECYNNMQEYKKQIQILEKQSQNYQRQYTALNELISLFIQTGV